MINCNKGQVLNLFCGKETVDVLYLICGVYDLLLKKYETTYLGLLGLVANSKLLRVSITGDLIKNAFVIGKIAICYNTVLSMLFASEI